MTNCSASWSIQPKKFLAICGDQEILNSTNYTAGGNDRSQQNVWLPNLDLRPMGPGDGDIIVDASRLQEVASAGIGKC